MSTATRPPQQRPWTLAVGSYRLTIGRRLADLPRPLGEWRQVWICRRCGWRVQVLWTRQPVRPWPTRYSPPVWVDITLTVLFVAVMLLGFVLVGLFAGGAS